MVNLIKVKKTSIAVVVALMMLFRVRINVQVSKAKYVRKHTQRYYQEGFVYGEDVHHSASNHGEDVALRKLS